MPKFSAYMRGERGAQGAPGQASILDGYVVGSNNLPNIETLSRGRNYLYYVQEPDYQIYLYLSENATQWKNLGPVTAGFSTRQYTSVTTISWTTNNLVPTVTITPHNPQQTTGLKSFDFNFGIPEGQPAGFSKNQSASINMLDWDKSATVKITPNNNTPNWEKSFSFQFGIPRSREAGFSTYQNVNTSTLNWNSNATVTVTTDNNSPFYSKVFNFNFGIPHGRPADFGTLSATVQLEDHLAPASLSISSNGPGYEKNIEFQLKIPQAHPAGIKSITTSTNLVRYDMPAIVSATATGHDWEKEFSFDFQIPQGRPAGFSSNMGISVSTLSSSSEATVNITPDETTPDYAKKFNFEFGIPHGVPGGFGEISTSTLQINSDLPAEVSISTSGPEFAKNFDFTFRIPAGKKGDKGDSLGVYLGIEFLSTDIDPTGTIYWDNNILHIKRDDNEKIPVYILNNQNNNIAATFEINNDEIIHEADSKFDGTLFLIAKSNIPKFEIHKCTTIPLNMEPYVEAYYPNEFDPSTIYLDFYLTRGTTTNYWNDIVDNPFTSISTNSYGSITTTNTSLDAISLNNNFLLKTDKWNLINTSTNGTYYEPFIYYNDSNGEKIGEISAVRKNGDIAIQIQASQTVYSAKDKKIKQCRNAFRIGVKGETDSSISGEPYFEFDNPKSFKEALGLSTYISNETLYIIF